jgi:pimeloyl-ACP methyl ester carboxylesterase
MSSYNHQTAPTQLTEAGGIRFAYRRFGKNGGMPLLFFVHFTGTMDHWDPALTDGFARDRELILFNNAGVSSSCGEFPASIEEMAQHAAAFIDSLGIKKLDALGFSMGGLIAQQLTIDRPDLIRKLILVGTGPSSGEGMASLTPEAQEVFGAKYDPADELWLASSLLHQSKARQPEGNISSGKGRARRIAILCRMKRSLRRTCQVRSSFTTPTLVSLRLRESCKSVCAVWAAHGGQRLTARLLRPDWP